MSGFDNLIRVINRIKQDFSTDKTIDKALIDIVYFTVILKHIKKVERFKLFFLGFTI